MLKTIPAIQESKKRQRGRHESKTLNTSEPNVQPQLRLSQRARADQTVSWTRPLDVDTDTLPRSLFSSPHHTFPWTAVGPVLRTTCPRERPRPAGSRSSRTMSVGARAFVVLRSNEPSNVSCVVTSTWPLDVRADAVSA